MVYTGYPPRYKYEGAEYGEYVAKYLNDVISGKRVDVRFFTFPSFSILRAEKGGKAADRIIKLVEHLDRLPSEPADKRHELIHEISHLLAFYADRQVLFADSDQAETGSKGEIVFQKEPLNYLVLDDEKLRKCLKHLASALFELEQSAAGTSKRSQQPKRRKHTAVLKHLRKCAELASEAIKRGPTAEEHRVQNYVLELAARDLLHKLRQCDCRCGCRRWLFQKKGIHASCEDCRRQHHVKSEEKRERRNRQAKDRYHIKKGNVLVGHSV